MTSLRFHLCPVYLYSCCLLQVSLFTDMATHLLHSFLSLFQAPVPDVYQAVCAKVMVLHDNIGRCDLWVWVKNPQTGKSFGL